MRHVSGSRPVYLRMENSGKKLPKKRGGVAGKNPGSESHPTTTESAQYGSALHQAKTSGIVSNEHFIKRLWLTLFRAADSRCGIQCAVAAIFVQISARNALIISQIHNVQITLQKIASSLGSLVYLNSQNDAPSHIDNLHAPSRTYR